MNTTQLTILLVDDEKKFLDSLSERIRLKGFKPLTALSGEEAVRIAKETQIDMAIVDQTMPGMPGMVTITKLKEIDPGIKTILLTGYGNEKLKEAAEALDAAYFEKDEMGRFWQFLKQFSSEGSTIIIKPPSGQKDSETTDVIADAHEAALNAEQFEMYAARQAMDRRRSQVEQSLPDISYAPADLRLVGETPLITELKKNIHKVSSLDCTVLILGETGTGKELVAKAIHMQSPRKGRKFTAVNCGSFSEDLLSNELFGHEKEAFTGALHRRKGVLEAASGGTILLDEIGDTPLPMQVKLLRVLEEKTLIRVGGTEEVPVDVRILAATNQSLQKKIDAGEFREDLYYRLNAFILRLPPLRERRDDIPLLSSYFLDKYRKQFGKEIKQVSDEVLSIFMQYPFPGNVRELENAIERAVIMCEGNALEKPHLPQRFHGVKPSENIEKTDLLSLSELETLHIKKVLGATKGNKSEAAKILGINRASLWRKLKIIGEQG